jgi:hypothetical protein
MALSPPVLDRRDHERILEQLRKLAAEYVPEWKGYQHPTGDAGVMLHRIFTRLLEITLERLNKAPGMNFDAFLNAVGVSLLPPVSARVPLTFSLTAGSPPTRVPQGTQVGIAPKGQQQAVDFETEADLTVVPSSLTAAWTMDPAWDRSANHFALIDGGLGFAPLLGATRLSHALFLGDERLLDFSRAELKITFVGPHSPEAEDQFRRITWQYVSNGRTSKLPATIGSTPNQITFSVVNPIDQTVLKGPSESPALRRGLRNRWLHAALERSLAEDPGPASLILKDVRVSISVTNVPPDFAFANSVPLDPTMPFHPFGEQPQVGDAFYLASSEAFSKPNATWTLHFECPEKTPNEPPDETQPTAEPQPTAKATLEWEFLGSTGWTKFESFIDPTASLSESGNVVLKSGDLKVGAVNGEDGLWIRVRIQSGDYGKAAEYIAVDPNNPSKGFTLKEGTGNLAPPLVTKLALSYQAEGVPEFVVTQNGFLLTEQTLPNAESFQPFVALQSLTPSIHADTAPSLYLGFDKLFPEELMTLFFVVAPRAFSGQSNPKRAAALTTPQSVQQSLRWEYFNGVTWVELAVVDRTNRLTQSGMVDILTPADSAPLAKFDLQESYWIRAMLIQTKNDGPPIRNDPLTSARLQAIFLNTVPAVQAVTISNEIVGSGNSLPRQTLRLTQSPILANPKLFVLEPELPSALERDQLEKDEGADAIQRRVNPTTNQAEIWIRWHEVADFNGSHPQSRHYTLDHGTGEIVFGNGTFGMIPPLGTNNIVANYQVGAGSAGNVPKGAVAQLKSPVPGIASVTNRLDADGGADLETVEIARERGPQTLRHQGRAISRTDFEWLAREAAGTRLARVVCLSNTDRALDFKPGWITLVIVPQGIERKPLPSAELIGQVAKSFSNRSFAGLSALNQVNVVGPSYLEVTVVAEVVLRDLRLASQVKRQVIDVLDKFLHPLTGGPSAEGWKLGRNVFASEIASVIHKVSEVDHLKSLQLVPTQAQHRIELAVPFVCEFDLTENALIVSRDGRKSALLAEPVAAGTELRFLTIKGFKVGDRLIQMLAPGVFNPPLTITAVIPDRESGTLVIGIEPWEYDRPAPGTLLSTANHRIKLPVSPAGLESSVPPLRFLTLEDFSKHEVVQIQLTEKGPALPLLDVKQVFPAPNVYVGGISLVCSGQHRITVSAAPTSLPPA